MQALLNIAPSGPLHERLQAIADALVTVNVEWLREQMSRGLEPPCCSHCAAPPWTRPGGVRYVQYHGAPAGELRLYLDGPTMMHRGAGTCIDIAAYDAACRIMRGDQTARAVIEPSHVPGQYHCVVVDRFGRHDVALDFDVGGCGCGK